MLSDPDGHIPSGIFVCVFYASTSNARLDFYTTIICEKAFAFLSGKQRLFVVIRPKPSANSYKFD